ncbi:hypothetical protein [Rhizobium sp. BK176]|uniref:hypothetical protein n=1 Tax=Rhizobium sp. BK176 TaxID=2587071 RepID=UPI0021682426|nr:hypothetical protein [Rhizobium sp. BK176]MCS4089194.1 protein gp37 [Rhizobium sp. BK176]
MVLTTKIMVAARTSMVTLGWTIVFFMTFTATLLAMAAERAHGTQRLVGPILLQAGLVAMVKGLYALRSSLAIPEKPFGPALRDASLGMVVVLAVTLPGLGGCLSLNSCS